MPHRPLRLLAVEDEVAQAVALRRIIGELGYELCAIAPTADAAETLFLAHQPDMVLLDVQLRGPRDGIDVAAALRARRPVPLIFLTAYADEATFARARQVGPAAFLGKPYNAALLGHSIELAFQHFAPPADALAAETGPMPESIALADGLFVRDSGRLVKIGYDAICTFEADDSYVHLHLMNGRKYTLRSSLRYLEAHLPVGIFVRIHRAHLVRRASIDAIDLGAGNVVVGGQVLPLGRTGREALRNGLPTVR